MTKSMSQAFEEMPGVSSIAQTFLEMPRQLQNNISMAFIMTMLKIWEKAECLKQSTFALNQVHLTLPNLDATYNWSQLFTWPNRGLYPLTPIPVPKEAMSFFCNYLGISGNAWDLNTIYFTPFHFWEIAKHSSKLIILLHNLLKF